MTDLDEGGDIAEFELGLNDGLADFRNVLRQVQRSDVVEHGGELSFTKSFLGNTRGKRTVITTYS